LLAAQKLSLVWPNYLNKLLKEPGILEEDKENIQ